MKYMFDSNVFDSISDCELTLISLSSESGNKYYLTTVQLEELNAIPDSENRFAKLLR